MTNLNPDHFINRELSWLEFNHRVLEEALDPTNPLLERLKFFCISSSNLDEFFEVRVAGIKQQIESDVVERSVDGMTASETFRAITRRVRQMVQDQNRTWREKLLPELAQHGIHFLNLRKLDKPDMAWVDGFYRTQVRPVLTPLAIDPAHPFPQLLNKTLNMMVRLEITKDGVTRQRLAVVQVPRVLARLVRLPRESSQLEFVWLGQVIGHFLPDLFPGTRILGNWLFRVTRNSELYIDGEEEGGNLLKAVEKELHNRRKGDAVRLEVELGCPEDIREQLLETLGLGKDDLYLVDGPLNPTRLMAVYEGDHSPELRDPPFVPAIARDVREEDDLFAAIRKRDLLLHHPYESFGTVVELLQQAAVDPRVLAIKMTLYRTGGDERIIGALMEAVNNGKQVTTVVELRARFDEANNIQWSRQLEQAGVHVVYGLVGYKIHSKLCLIVRRDDDGIRRYVHLGTGNYNPTTARLYTDVSLLTCQPDFGEDVTSLFNLLTGICQFQGTRKLLVAPFDLKRRILELIRREITHARDGLPAAITAKMNSLVDPDVIQTLYEASRAGVNIHLIVRGICCLRPGVKGVSENITVTSVVGRFLEHSRIFLFENACRPEVFVGSADWMPRNFVRRIETIFPVEDGRLRDRLINELLTLSLADNVKARQLQPNGFYRHVSAGSSKPRQSQEEFVRLAVRGVDSKSKSGKGKSSYPRMRLRSAPKGRAR